VFRNDSWFKKAIECLEMVVFHTNGFDILACVEKTLVQIEKAAYHYNGGLTVVFPFEVTFGLFLGVVISSQIRHWGKIAGLVEAYTPAFGLCPSFEFSRAKVIASHVQMKQMLEEARSLSQI
jgi:hypothetical protein